MHVAQAFPHASCEEYARLRDENASVLNPRLLRHPARLGHQRDQRLPEPAVVGEAVGEEVGEAVGSAEVGDGVGPEVFSRRAHPARAPLPARPPSVRDSPTHSAI